MATRPDSARDQLIAVATAHHQAGRLGEAEAQYRAAPAPGRPAVLHNLGVLAAEQGRHEEAIACLDAAPSRWRVIVAAS